MSDQVAFFTIYGEAGNDFIQGGAGDDYLIGGKGADSMQGQGGDDIVYADADDTWFSGDDGVDWLVYEGANDLHYALAQGAFEHVRAGSGNNAIYGTEIGNIIELEDGNDIAFGYAGNDRIEGGTGDDWMVGGSGSDLFVFKNEQSGHDTITDFSAGHGSEDVLQFETAMFANYAAVIASACQYGSNTVISIDANTSITLENVAKVNLHQDDFLFV